MIIILIEINLAFQTNECLILEHSFVCINKRVESPEPSP